MWMYRLLQRVLGKGGFELRRRSLQREFQHIPDATFYSVLFSPWRGYGSFGPLMERIAPYTLVSPDRCHVLYSLAQQAQVLEGEVWECGVYRGGTAMLLQATLREQGKSMLRLFDTFEGMPKTSAEKDLHRKGDFSDTTLEAVRGRLHTDTRTFLHRGLIPDSFAGLESSRIALAHIDVDIYQSVLDCCEFIYPRMSGGGFLLFDDYGFPSCPGARQAVDEFFRDKPETPLVLPTGQALVFVAPR